MGTNKIQLRSAGKGFVLAASNGLPLMRRLVEMYSGTDNRTYIKFDDEVQPGLPSHKFLSAN